jgi:acyl-CoA synthetase (AMP-forming)/AMP-acid ligase II
MFIVRKPGQPLEKEILAFLAERRVAKWWVPDDVIFLESPSVGGTQGWRGDLRKTYGGVFAVKTPTSALVTVT